MSHDKAGLIGKAGPEMHICFFCGFCWTAIVRDALSTYSGNICLCAEVGSALKRLLHQ